nr:hypothetical protein [Tanacetum cinerariifolium]
RGSGVEVVEWRENGESGVVDSWREKRAEVLQCTAIGKQLLLLVMSDIRQRRKLVLGWCRPIGWDSFSMWDCEQDHMGWSGEVDGTVQVSTGVRECSVGKGIFWREIWLKGYCLGSRGLGNGQDWPLGFVGVVNQVLGLKV